jgi:hypothetical protein
MGVIHDQKGELLHRRLVLGLGAFSAMAVLDGLQNAARAESGGIKLTVLYTKPKDPDAFNKYYHPTAPAGSTRAAILADHRALLPERRRSPKGARLRGG